MQLNLSHRNLRSLDSAIIASYGDCIEYLDLSHNRIKDLMFLYDFPHLKCLIMDDNRLRETHFDRLNRPLTEIHTLMLNKNEVSVNNYLDYIFISTMENYRMQEWRKK